LPVSWQRLSRKQAHDEAGLLYVCVKLPHSPPMPVTVMMMAMVVVMVPAVPTMMVVVMMAVVSPVHFRRR
jgi:hypothetical protein